MAIIHFIIDITMDLSNLSDPKILAIARSKEEGIYAKIYIITSSKKHGDSHG